MIIWQARVAALSFSDIAGSTDRVQNSNSKMQFSLLKSKKRRNFSEKIMNREFELWPLGYELKILLNLTEF